MHDLKPVMFSNLSTLNRVILSVKRYKPKLSILRKNLTNTYFALSGFYDEIA